MAAEEEVRTFLLNSNLSQYFECFLEQGYDDLKQIIDLTNSREDLDSMMNDVGLNTKPGHKKRFLAVVTIEASKSKHGSKNEIPKVPASNHESNFEECTGTDISRWPKIAQDLWIPNPLNDQMKFYNKVLSDLFLSSFDLMSLLQFKDYVATQRVTRWRLKNEIELQARKFTPESAIWHSQVTGINPRECHMALSQSPKFNQSEFEENKRKRRIGSFSQ